MNSVTNAVVLHVIVFSRSFLKRGQKLDFIKFHVIPYTSMEVSVA